MLLQIAGNCGTIADRSFDVPNSVTRGRFGVGLVVDFLALSGMYSGYPVDFAYAHPSAVTPASIGLVAGARNPEDGRRFIDFTLSAAGQSLLLRPEISRVPVRADGVGGALPGDYPDLVAVLRAHPSAYDPDVSEARYLVVNALFNQVVTFRHRELAEVTRAIQAAERRLERQPDAAARALLDAARRLAYGPPLAENDALLANPGWQTRVDVAAIARREAEWARRSRDNYASALTLARQASGLAER